MKNIEPWIDYVPYGKNFAGILTWRLQPYILWGNYTHAKDERIYGFFATEEEAKAAMKAELSRRGKTHPKGER